MYRIYGLKKHEIGYTKPSEKKKEAVELALTKNMAVVHARYVWIACASAEHTSCLENNAHNKFV